MSEIFLGVAADDFTGASDAASFLVAAGVPTVLFNGIPAKKPVLREGTAAIVVALKSRTIPAGQAVKESLEAFEWMQSMGAKQLYFKYCSTFDSTSKGNIGPVADAVMEKYDVPYTVLCPSLPVNGRTLKDGMLFVNGVLLEQSHMKDHPLTPMRDSSIPRLIESQSKYKAVTLKADQLGCSGEAMNVFLNQTASSEQAHYYVVPDYYEDEHGDAIAEAFGDLKFLTGGSGLVGALGRRFVRKCAKTATAAAEARQVQENASAGVRAESDASGCGVRAESGARAKSGVQSGIQADGQSLMLAGSCSAITLKQIAAYKAAGHDSYRIYPEKMLKGEDSAEHIFQWIREHGNATLVYSSASPEELKESQSFGKELVADMLEKTISTLARMAVDAGYTRIITAGGETSGAVTKALDYSSFYIGESVAPGVPVMTPVENPALRLVLKSGNFGQEDFFERAAKMTAEQ